MKLFGKRNTNDPETESLLEEIYGREKDREISELEAAAERAGAYDDARRLKRRRAFLRGAAVTLVLFALTVGLILLGYNLLFKISEFSVEGVSVYSAEEIIDGIGVPYGTPIFSFRESDARAALIYSCPYVSDLQVNRSPPGKVTLTVKCEEAVYFTEIYGKIYLLSPTLRVLGEAAEGDTEGLVRLCLPEVRQVELGRTPVFRDAEAEALLFEVTREVCASELADRIGKIDLRDLFELRMVCDGKYLMHFGEYTEVDTKLRIASTVLEDSMFTTENKARIDLSDLSKTSVIIDNQLDLEA